MYKSGLILFLNIYNIETQKQAKLKAALEYAYAVYSKVTDGCSQLCLVHYNDVIMSAMASQITSLMIMYSTVYSGADQSKHQSSASLAFVRGIHRWPVNFPAQMASNAENVSIWWRHHATTWHRTADGPLPDWTYICVIRPRWFNVMSQVTSHTTRRISSPHMQLTKYKLGKQFALIEYSFSNVCICDWKLTIIISAGQILYTYLSF